MPAPGVIFTIGHSNRSLDAFLALIVQHGVQLVADVRSRPFSRFAHFNRPRLEASLAALGIAYVWLGPELGGHREDMSFEDYLLTDAFAAGLAHLEALAAQHPTAILCAEGRPDKCHRQHISRALELRGWEVRHIINAEETWTSPSGPQLQLGA